MPSTSCKLTPYAYVVFKIICPFYFVGHRVVVNQLKVCIIYFNPDTVTTTFESEFLYLFIFGIALVGGIVSFFNTRFDKT